MTPFRRHLTLAAFAVAALLAGCETAPPLEGDAGAPVESRSTPPGGGTAGASGAAGAAGATPQSQVAPVDLARGGATPGAVGGAGGTSGAALPTGPRIVYFDFDSFVIREEFKPLLDGQARQLTGNRGKRVVIEGHADDRGSREYNLALGQKRAEAVLRMLALLGVAESQLEAVSFGEERPAVQGHDEAAWAKNRRAELKER